MANFARIVDGVAVDVSTAPAATFHPSIAAEFVAVPAQVAVGWRLDDGEWSEPPEPEPVPEPEPLTWANAPAEYFQIGVGPFFDRFGAKALSITSSTDATVQGLVTLLIPRQYVDLKRPDLSPMLQILVDKGILTAAEKTAILTAPTSDYERHVKGLPQPVAS